MKGTKSAESKKEMKGTKSAKSALKSAAASAGLKKAIRGTEAAKDHLKTTALTTKSDAMYMPDAEMDVRKDYKENMSRVAKGNFSTDKALMEMKAKVKKIKEKKYTDSKNGK